MPTIDWPHFTPWAALAGGVLIGLSAAMFVLLNGRIAGVSGVLGGLLRPMKGDMAWRAAFVLGLVGAPLVYGLARRSPRSLAATVAFIAAGVATVFVTRHLLNLS